MPSIQDWEFVRKPEILQAFADYMYGQLPRDFDQIHYKVEPLPFDQNQLIASMALRAVYVAIAIENLWADPKGEFLSLMLASRFYG